MFLLLFLFYRFFVTGFVGLLKKKIHAPMSLTLSNFSNNVLCVCFCRISDKVANFVFFLVFAKALKLRMSSFYMRVWNTLKIIKWKWSFFLQQNKKIRKNKVLWKENLFKKEQELQIQKNFEIKGKVYFPYRNIYRNL